MTTTYSNNFVGHQGKNQYVKKIEKPRNYTLPFKANTTYKKEFIMKVVDRLNNTFSCEYKSEKLNDLDQMIYRNTCHSSYEQTFSKGEKNKQH